MIDEAAKPSAPFQEILVWKFSRFTRKREHAVAFKSMLRRKGVRVVSITEHADDTPTGKLMEAIIESVDEFYSENLAQEVTRGMREAASRGFWVASRVPYGFRKVYVQDGAKKRPTLEPDEDAARVVKSAFDMAEAGRGMLDIARALNDEGHRQPRRKALVQERRPSPPQKRSLHRRSGLGHERQGQGRPGARREGVPQHRLQGPIPPRETADALKGAQEDSPPPRREHLPAQRSGQVQGVRPGVQRAGGQERPVLLLRLPVHHEARQGSLRFAQDQRPAIRGDDSRQHSLQHPHRRQHPRPG